MQPPLPDCTQVAEAFWNYEAYHGYCRALEMCADEFDISQADVEALVIEDDNLNSGNS